MLQSRGNRDNTLRFLALCGAAAPVIFAVLVTVGGLVYEGYSHATQAISELGGVEAQYPVIQNANFLVVGILITAFALGLHRGIRDGKGSKLGPVLLGLFGVITVAQALLPCDPGCEFESLTGALHNLTGLGSFVAAVIGILAISRRSKSDPRWHSYRGYSVITSAVALVALLAWIGIAKVAEIGSLNGVLQRIFVGLVLLWIEVMALRLLWLSRRSPVDMQRESIPGQCPGLTRAESSGQVSILPDDDNKTKRGLACSVRPSTCCINRSAHYARGPRLSAGP